MTVLDYAIYLAISMIKLFLFSVYTDTAFSFGFFILNFASVLVLSSWTLLLKAKTRRWVLFSLLFLHSTLIVSDIWYYRYFEDLLSVMLIADVPQMSSVGGGFLTLVAWKDLLFFTDLILFSAAVHYFRNQTGTLPRKNRIRFAGAGFAAGLVVFTVPLAWSYLQQEEWLVDNPISNMREYYQLGFWGYHGADLLKGAASLAESNGLSADQMDLLPETLSEIEAAPVPEELPNVIVVQLESYQSSVIGQEINGTALTPNLNELREETIYFPNFYHQTHEGRTSDAEFLTLSSLHPIKSGSVYTQYAGNDFNGLPAHLQRYGYNTVAMHAFERSFWNRDEFYDNIGFDEFYSKQDFSQEGQIGMALNDKDFFSESIEYISDLETPFFAFMVALTSHTPYEFPQDLEKMELSAYDDELVRGYYHTVHYVDEAIGEMVSDLKQRGLWEDSLIVFYGDHDSGLTQKGTAMAEDADADNVVDLFKLDHGVPLFIKTPGSSSGEINENVGGQIDIAPTILDMVNIDPPYMLGNSLMDEEENVTVFRDGSFRYNDFYYKPDLTAPIGSGTCYSTLTEEQVAYGNCKDKVEEAAEQLRISDLIIHENALEKIRER
ncbi:LTA synthase family protein [Planococcus halotolerans]|uniref:LTA synthase family protein n=1 Tax=Planococcus halotolerans TaxID=2233542 RepID=A0A365KY60_9BACL|nr:LTA synthase family protein [Planococcus halotolerans]RAZ77893.1 LTA synthase family protein [Planococcus halotolerans]